MSVIRWIRDQIWQKHCSSFLSILKNTKCTLFLLENNLHFMKKRIRPHYEKLKPFKSGFIENSNFENNRDFFPTSLELCPGRQK